MRLTRLELRLPAAIAILLLLVSSAFAAPLTYAEGGRVWAEAVPDEGATFFFTLETRHA